MESLEEYSKDWKQIKNRRNSADKNFLTIENKKIMNNIIQFEKRERRENKWGIGLGLTGILFGAVFGIATPIYVRSLSLNAFIISGVILMLLGIVYMHINTQIERIDVDRLGENSQAYLLSIKEKLQNSGKRKSWYGIAYVTFIMFGIYCIYRGIFVQLANGQTFFDFAFLMPIVFGILGWVSWKIRYNRKQKNKIDPLIEEIDQMLAGMK